jgi:adenine-specific DNA-methyltransferase
VQKNIYQYLSKYYNDDLLVDSLITGAFLHFNNLQVIKNKLILRYIINVNTPDGEILRGFIEVIETQRGRLDFEDLIELFEFVVSPADKIVNGAVYTPSVIREYIVRESLDRSFVDPQNIKVSDISCGCGGFLLTVAQEIQLRTNRSYYDIFNENIYGIDLTQYSIDRAKLLLTLYALSHGEDVEHFEFNLYVGNSMNFDWRDTVAEIRESNGFDVIVGNPPYVASRNMDPLTLEMALEWEVSRSGHPDLYIPFFQIGLENLNGMGVLGYITVNTFIKSVNGRALRSYFANNRTDLTILNFGGEQVFKSRNTYTCVCFLQRIEGQIHYLRTTSDTLGKIDLNELNHFLYESLNHNDGWNLVNQNDTLEFINQVESVGTPFKDLYDTKNGIATLKNDIYKFKPSAEDDAFYYLTNDADTYPIEKGICRDIVNANKIKNVEDLDKRREKIIFPYDDGIRILSEETMQHKFPSAYSYLGSKRAILDTRDKGKTKGYEAWYAYGRRQSMDINAFKLFFPHICERPTFVICEEPDLLFYNGMAVVSNDLEELKILKKIMESDLFFEYIKNTTKDYSSGYISMSRNYLKNFGIYNFNKEQKRELMETDDVNNYLEQLYGLTSKN